MNEISFWVKLSITSWFAYKTLSATVILTLKNIFRRTNIAATFVTVVSSFDLILWLSITLTRKLWLCKIELYSTFTIWFFFLGTSSWRQWLYIYVILLARLLLISFWSYTFSSSFLSIDRDNAICWLNAIVSFIFEFFLRFFPTSRFLFMFGGRSVFSIRFLLRVAAFL